MNVSYSEMDQAAGHSTSRNTYATLIEPEFRVECDGYIADLVAGSLAANPDLAEAMTESSFTRELFVRSTIESVLRIELMRSINPLAASRLATVDPFLCKQWGLYAADEGLHGRMFAKDLHAVGVQDDEIYSTRPLFATQLLAGYLLHTLHVEGALAVLASAYYVETVSALTQPTWLDAMEKVVGHEATLGARAHLALDVREGHVDLAWNMCMRLVKAQDARKRFKEHIAELHALLVAYVVEVRAVTSGAGSAEAVSRSLAGAACSPSAEG